MQWHVIIQSDYYYVSRYKTLAHIIMQSNIIMHIIGDINPFRNEFKDKISIQNINKKLKNKRTNTIEYKEVT